MHIGTVEMIQSPDAILCLRFQAFKMVWKLACSQPGKAKIVTQAEKTYLVRPISFGGPCTAKLKFRVRSNH